MSESGSLYERDFVRWSEEQSAAIRAAASSGTNLQLDWENIAEEIDTLGRSQRHELRRRTRTLIRHLLKLQCSPANDPNRGWENTVRRTRQDIEDVLRDSPSLRGEIVAVLEAVLESEIALTAEELEAAGETGAAAAARSSGRVYEAEAVFGDWLPRDATG